MKYLNLNVGDRLEIYWPLDRKYYPGHVAALLPNSHFRIIYDDGDSETLFLAKEKWRALPPLPVPHLSSLPMPKPPHPRPHSTVKGSNSSNMYVSFDRSKNLMPDAYDDSSITAKTGITLPVTPSNNKCKNASRNILHSACSFLHETGASDHIVQDGAEKNIIKKQPYSPPLGMSEPVQKNGHVKASKKKQSGLNQDSVASCGKSSVLLQKIQESTAVVKDDAVSIVRDTPFERLKSGISKACVQSIDYGMEELLTSLRRAEEANNGTPTIIYSEIERCAEKQEHLDQRLKQVDAAAKQGLPRNEYEQTVRTKLDQISAELNKDVSEALLLLRSTLEQHVTAEIQQAKSSNQEIMKEMKKTSHVAIENALQKGNILKLLNTKAQQMHSKRHRNLNSDLKRCPFKKRVKPSAKSMAGMKKERMDKAAHTKKSRKYKD